MGVEREKEKERERKKEREREKLAGRSRKQGHLTHRTEPELNAAVEGI